MHELVHIACRDNLVGIVHMTLCCIFWFHPAVWFIKRKLLEERERACDEFVVGRDGGPGGYISALLKVVRFGLSSQQSAGLANTAGANLKKRMELIMKNNTESTSLIRQRLIVVSTTATLAVLCFVAVFAMVRTGSAANSAPANQSEAQLYALEIYSGGELYSTMELAASSSGRHVFQYGLYHIPNGTIAHTAEGDRIYGFQVLPQVENESVKVEIVAVLEDLAKVSNEYPLHEMSKRLVATYSLNKSGEATDVSEMSRLGAGAIALRVVELDARKSKPATYQSQQDPKVFQRFVRPTDLLSKRSMEMTF